MTSAVSEQPAGRAPGSRRAFFAILLLAAFLRLYRLDLISVTNETALQQLTASAALSLEGWNWPLAGPPTEPVRSSAFLVTGIALANLAWTSPFAGNVFVIALNLGAVAILYRLCLKQFGFRAAWIATLLYAASPWGILYSRYLLSCSCLAIFSVLLVDFSLRWLETPRRGLLAIMVLLAFVIPQIHFSGLWVPLWLTVVLFLRRKEISYLSLAVGGGLAAAAWAPWVSFHHMTGCSELTAWGQGLAQAPMSYGRSLVESVEHLIWLLHSAGFDAWFGTGVARSPEFFPGWLRWTSGLTTVLLTALLFVSVMRIITAAGDRAARLLLLWLVLSVLFGALLRTNASPDNMLIAQPIAFALIGIAAARVKDTLPRALRIVPPAAALAIGITHVALLARWAQLVESGALPSLGRYQLSYRERQATLRSVLDDSVAAPAKIVGSASGWYPAYEYLLLYEPPKPAERIGPTDGLYCYWIDEEPGAAGVNESAWRNRKERQINPAVSESLRTPPDWEIQRHWSIGKSQVYRLRLVIKQPLR
jgi:hypothetical protein